MPDVNKILDVKMFEDVRLDALTLVIVELFDNIFDVIIFEVRIFDVIIFDADTFTILIF